MTGSGTVLITGASGMVGTVLMRHWRSRYRIVAHSRERPIEVAGVQSVRFSLDDRAAVERVLTAANPELIVHAAAWTDVDACEEEPERAMMVNADASGWIARAARAIGSSLIYVSTDTVFDGKTGGYVEEDSAIPVNRYSASKLAGEQAVLNENETAVVLRIGPEGWRSDGTRGFIQWVVDGLRSKRLLTVCQNWTRSTVFTPNLPMILEAIWLHRLSGIYHSGPPVPASNWVQANMVADVLQADKGLLLPIDGDSLKLGAPRPGNTFLNSEKLTSQIGPLVWHVRQGIESMLAEMPRTQGPAGSR